MSDALTLADIETLKPEIKNDVSGTRRLPIIAALLPDDPQKSRPSMSSVQPTRLSCIYSSNSRNSSK